MSIDNWYLNLLQGHLGVIQKRWIKCLCVCVFTPCVFHDSQHALLVVLRIEKCTERSAFFPWFLGVLLAKGRVALGVGYLDLLEGCWKKCIIFLPNGRFDGDFSSHGIERTKRHLKNKDKF